MSVPIKKIFAATLVAINISFIALAQSTAPIVKTDRGYIKGVAENDIAVFKGVPYAAPPEGNLRFMPPVEHQLWKDTLSTIQFGSVATQPGGKQPAGSENCLTLNVYTPHPDNRKRAVVVWVHGGSMTAGAGKGNNGHAFADNDDIVTVTINYRLGSLGFLYMGDVDPQYRQSGNCGLLDCIAALKWVKKNITSFGGDPNRVTIMGESAGAKLISAVWVSPLSNGLFQQFIAESGSVQCIRDTMTAKNARLKILKQLGLKANDVRKLLTLPADTIMKAQAKVCAGIGGNSFFGPVYDGVTIPADGYQYARSKQISPVKALIGTNKYEAALFVNGDEALKHPGPEILRSLFGDNYPVVYKEYQKELKTNAPYDAAVKVLTQYMYQMHSYRFAAALAQNNDPVWLYRFDYENGKKYGAQHAAELEYIWTDGKPKASDTQTRMANTLHTTWVAFIKTGRPDNKTIPGWPLYNTTDRKVMVFDTVSRVEELKEVFNDKDFPSQVFMLK